MTVWNTITNMRALDASIESFFRILEEEIGDQDWWRLRDPESLASSSSLNGWCYYSSYIRYPLRRVPRGEGHPRGPANLTVAVELWREVPNQEGAWQYAREPLIYVGFCPFRDDWWSEQDMACDYRGIPIPFPEGEVVPPTEDAPYLWTLNNEEENLGWSRRNWYFILNMFSINSREEIQSEIIGPLYSLIGENANRDVAFEGTNVINVGPRGQ